MSLRTRVLMVEQSRSLGRMAKRHEELARAYGKGWRAPSPELEIWEYVRLAGFCAAMLVAFGYALPWLLQMAK